jgi:uncharacterized protein YndB with AHSA1/START domain
MNDDTSMRIERVIDAAPDAVFDTWTTAESMEQWYREGEHFVARVTELDVRVGGRYRVEFGPVGQDPFVEHGEYLEIDRPHLLVMTETLEGVDSPWANTTVTLELRLEGGKTHLTLTHRGFPSREHRDIASGGWPGFLDRIERLLAER